MSGMALLALIAKGSEEKLTAQEALSGIFGSVSLATWIFLLVSIVIIEDILLGKICANSL